MLTVDYETKPYAQWLEEVLPEMVELDPVSIGMVMIMPDGTVGTVYYNVDRHDMEVMQRAIADDSLIEFLKENADVVAQILAGEDGEDYEGCEPDTEDN